MYSCPIGRVAISFARTMLLQDLPLPIGGAENDDFCLNILFVHHLYNPISTNGCATIDQILDSLDYHPTMKTINQRKISHH